MWRSAKAANTTGKQTWPEYLSKCSDKLAKQAAKEAKAEAKANKAEAKAEAKPKTKAETNPPKLKSARAEPRYAGNPTPAQKAMYKRMGKCGEQWRSAKAAGKTGNQTWPEYWDKCSDRLKAKE